MEKVKSILAAALMIYIFIGIYIILYNLLIWHFFPKIFSYTLLAALVMLKGAIISMRYNQPEAALKKCEKNYLGSIFQISLLLFFAVLLFTYLFERQYISAFISLSLLLLTAYKVKVLTHSRL
ncbi:hypothetical protein GCM10023149_02220 [Mucilaginibacter gynuensis]|uniref:Uncharacterized protein n=1 Tax=Mucilaginibacter gynuensis TaxID=1302236 RepID=A0ABP8FPQ2_9SPHI